MRRCPVGLALAVLAMVSCTTSGTIGLLSDGTLEGRRIDPALAEAELEGQSCGPRHYLASAFRDALEGTHYDTLINVEVTTTTGVLVIHNCIRVRGRALDSKTLPSIAGSGGNSG